MGVKGLLVEFMGGLGIERRIIAAVTYQTVRSPVATPISTGQDAAPLENDDPGMPERLARPIDPEPSNHRLRFELIFASIWLGVGLFVVPALIFWFGVALLGPYGEGERAGLGTFYANFFGDLATGEVRTWLLALGPLLLISLIRAIFIGVRRPEAETTEAMPSEEPLTSRAADQRRVEPRID